MPELLVFYEVWDMATGQVITRVSAGEDSSSPEFYSIIQKKIRAVVADKWPYRIARINHDGRHIALCEVIQ